MVNFFNNKIATLEISDNELKSVFQIKHDYKNFIQNYTADSFYYKSINKYLREGNFNSFKTLSNHISKFIYCLYEYRKAHSQPGELTLYRKMNITFNEFKVYLE